MGLGILAGAAGGGVLAYFVLTRGMEIPWRAGALDFPAAVAVTVALAVVDVYDDQSGLWTVDSLSSARKFLCATAVGQLALFAGGALDNVTATDVVDVFDVQSLSWLPTATLSQALEGADAVFGPNTDTGLYDIYGRAYTLAFSLTY